MYWRCLRGSWVEMGVRGSLHFPALFFALVSLLRASFMVTALLSGLAGKTEAFDAITSEFSAERNESAAMQGWAPDAQAQE